MERKNVVLSDGDMARQREFTEKIKDLHIQRGKAVHALVDTFGCQQNVADSQHIMGMLEAMGCDFVTEPAEADIIVLNTCAIRDHAEKRVYGNLGALTHTKKANPEQIICLCGCMAQEPHVADRIRRSYRHVDLVFGPHELWRFPEFIHTLMTQKGRIFQIADQAGSIAEGIPLVRQDKVKAWVSIMYGCNNFCSYCIVPHVRGRERSRPREAIVREVRELVAAGYRDITLLGQNVNSYGRGLAEPCDFATLVEELDAIPGDWWLRFMTSHPKDAGRRLIDVMAAGRHIAPAFHLPLQSGNDRVLHAMNRHYDMARYMDTVRYMREKIPDLTLTSDIIVGFPGETEAEFEDTLRALSDIRFDMIYSFIYSPRKGTPAAEMEQVPEEVQKNRFARMLELQNGVSMEKNQPLVGKTLRVLCDGVSKSNADLWTGRTAGNKSVFFPGSSDTTPVGQFIPVRIERAAPFALYGKAENPADIL